ncbi:MAG: chloride channel protein [Chitinophagaceae bacterium]|nr:MAG: chloride channel protein [Chitinophagaceae bacterium]
MRPVKRVYQFFIYFLRTKLTRVQYIMLVATLVGLSSGMAAVLLKTLVHYLQHWIVDADVSNLAYLLFPAVGLLITVFIVRTFFGSYFEKGIAMVLRSIARKNSFIPLSHTYQHVITSSITVGLGGSAGLEAPIVATGSAIGSNIARISDLSYRERTLLIGCGAAAGISAVFNAPIAGVIFAIEVLLTETIVSYFIPLIISSVLGALCSRIILQESSGLFNFVLQEKFNYNNVPGYIFLGLIAGFVSLYYARAFKSTEHRLSDWKFNAYAKALTGGLILAALYFLFPPLFGEGYESIKLVATGQASSITEHVSYLSVIESNWSIVLFAGLIILLKPIAAAVTLGSGGNGGNFAPSLFTGAYLGFFFSKLLNNTGWFRVPESNFSLVGMAGVLSGVMYCPLSAIFLIAEITNGYELFIPLMLTSSISFFIVKSYQRYSMETKQLVKEGEIFTHQKEKNILTSLRLDEMLQEKYDSIGIDKNLADLVELIKKSDRNIFAVHDSRNRFVGIIELNDIKQRLFEQSAFEKTSIKSLLKKPAATLPHNMSMHAVMETFDITHSWYLPVLNNEKVFLGFISKSKLFSKYRESLASQTDLYDEA